MFKQLRPALVLILATTAITGLAYPLEMMGRLAQEFATQWLWTYNNEGPNMGIGGITPTQKLKMAT